MELKYEQDGNSGFSIDSEDRKDIASVWIEEENYIEAKKLALLFTRSPKMLEVLQGIKRLQPIIEWAQGEDNEYTWNGEAEVLSNMFNQIDNVIKDL